MQAPKIHRSFDGKQYELKRQVETRAEADIVARKARKEGLSCRIIRSSQHWYGLKSGDATSLASRTYRLYGRKRG